MILLFRDNQYQIPHGVKLFIANDYITINIPSSTKLHVRDFIFSHFLSYLINICVFTTISKFSDTNYDNRIVTFVQDCHINWLLQMVTFAIIPSKRASYLYINIQMWFSSINIFFLISFFTTNTTCYKKQMIQELHNC